MEEQKTVDTYEYQYKDGKYSYTDRVSGVHYLWNASNQQWEEFKEKKTDESSSESELESEEEGAQKDSRTTNDSGKYVPKASEFSRVWDSDLGTYTYIDADGHVLFWDYEKQSWLPKQSEAEAEEPNHSLPDSENIADRSAENVTDKNNIRTPEFQADTDSKKVYDPVLKTYTFVDSEGAVFFWDYEKQAWFPKITEDFLAEYQMNYGQTSSAEAPISNDKPTPAPQPITESEPPAKKKVPSQPAWFDLDDAHNTKIYVSQLPLDLTEEEFVELASKCGMILRDIHTGHMKVKLYRDEEGNFKGDALCTYIKVESVDLALNILDGYQFKGHTIHVERAKFHQKGQYDPSLKPKKKKKDKEKLNKIKEKLFDWRPDKLRGERAKHEKVVVLHNMFDVHDFEKDPSLLLTLQDDLREECNKLGTVKKVLIFDRNPGGIVQVFFSTIEQADRCIQRMDGRWFGGRQLHAETWDGVTKYLVEETEKEYEERVKGWTSFLTAD